MAGAALMLMGTGSDVGKSLIAAGLARAFTLRGLKVRPFKPQNMSNNAAVAPDGGEIGRAQALQALACKVPPSVHMNPVLLKPETDTGAQVILRGKWRATLAARDYQRERVRLLRDILQSFRLLQDEADIVIVEGAGSPAEINLRDGDIANMGFAHAADIPVALIGDIHRGGVIAAIVGTLEVIAPGDAARLKAFLINNFHGDPALFSDGVSYLEQRTGLPCAGVVPHFADARKLPAEDALALERAARPDRAGPRIAVPRLSRIANFDDLDPLRLAGCGVDIVQPGSPIPVDADLVLVPGSKSTMADLAYLRRQGWDIDILAHARRGGRVLGLCGGYQMLGRMVHDPDGREGRPGSMEGLGLLDVETVLGGDKTLNNTSAIHAASSEAVQGYEIHLGRTEGPDRARPFAHIGGAPEGARSQSGLIEGTYLHGIFASDGFRRAYLADLGASDSLDYGAEVERTLDALAAHLEAHLDLGLLLEIARTGAGARVSAAGAM